MLALAAARRATSSRTLQGSLHARHVSGYFNRMNTPWNPGVVIVPQQTAWVIETFGRYDKVLQPGLRFLIPFVQRISYVFSLKEEAISVPSQTAITRDNVSVSIDGVLFVKVTDAYKAAYGVEDPHFAVTQLAQTTMRSEIGKLTLDRMFEERETLNHNIVRSINESAADWGIRCMRYEIRDISPTHAIKVAMEMQAEAERRKRALILDSEGEKDAEINIATGKKLSRVLASEAVMQERINLGKGDAAAVEAHAVATAAATRAIAEALGSERGAAATSLRLAEQYVQAFKGIAQSGSTVIVPANAGDIGAMVAQAMAIYKQTLQSHPAGGSAGGDGDATAKWAAQNRGQGTGRFDQTVSEASSGDGGTTSSLGVGDDASAPEGGGTHYRGDSAAPQATTGAFKSDFKDQDPASR